MAEVKLKVAYKGELRIIGTVRDTNKKLIIGYVIMHEQSRKLSFYNEDQTLVLLSRFKFSNAKIDENDSKKIVNTECSMDRLLIFDRNMRVIDNFGVTILGKIIEDDNTLGYMVLTRDGKITNVKSADLINSNSNLINGKFVTINGKTHISAIKEEFATVTIDKTPTSETVPANRRQSKTKINRIIQHREKVYNRIIKNNIDNPKKQTAFQKSFGPRGCGVTLSYAMKIYANDKDTYMHLAEDLRYITGEIRKLVNAAEIPSQLKVQSIGNLDKIDLVATKMFGNDKVYFYKKGVNLPVKEREKLLDKIDILWLALSQYHTILHPEVYGDVQNGVVTNCSRYGMHSLNYYVRDKLDEYRNLNPDATSIQNHRLLEIIDSHPRVKNCNDLGILLPTYTNMLHSYMTNYGTHYMALRRPPIKKYPKNHFNEKDQWLVNLSYLRPEDYLQLGFTADKNYDNQPFKLYSDKTVKLKYILRGVPCADNILDQHKCLGDLSLMAQVYKRWVNKDSCGYAFSNKKEAIIEMMLAVASLVNPEFVNTFLTTNDFGDYIPFEIRDKMLPGADLTTVTDYELSDEAILYYKSGFNIYLNDTRDYNTKRNYPFRNYRRMSPRHNISHKKLYSEIGSVVLMITSDAVTPEIVNNYLGCLRII